jgi:hypothetical protein
MRCVCAISAAAAGLLVISGCGKGPGRGGEAPAPPLPADRLPSQAQPKLPTVKLWLGDQELLAEVARSAVELRTGMMFRTNLAENEAMLFVFPRPHRASFYMRNTKLPLTCAYIDVEGVILELHDLKPLDEQPVAAATDRVQFALETRQGWFGRHNVGVGALVRTDRGALGELNWATLRPLRRR